MKIKILIPIYNDWQSLIKVLENINSEIYNLEHTPHPIEFDMYYSG